MRFLTIKLDDEAPTCQRCGNRTRLIGKMLDPKQGQTVRMFICQCGELNRIVCEPSQ
jgi:hypothetical protein